MYIEYKPSKNVMQQKLQTYKLHTENQYKTLKAGYSCEASSLKLCLKNFPLHLEDGNKKGVETGF